MTTILFTSRNNGRLKALIVIFVFVLLNVNAFSAYLLNVPVELKQPDGTTINCFITGDEFHRRLHDADNFTIVQNPVSGYYVFALKEGDRLIPSEYVVGKSDPQQLGIEPNLDIPASKMEEMRTVTLKSANNLKSTKIVTECPTTGNINNIIISIRFSDQNQTILTTHDYETKFNSETELSLRSYFKEVSNSQLNVSSHFFPSPQNQLIIEYVDPYPRAYYSSYNELSNLIGYKEIDAQTEREKKLLKNALLFATKSIEDNNLNVDVNNDGIVDNVIFVINGSTDLWGNILWPQKSSLLDQNISINNKIVGTYNKQFSSQFNVSTINHEFFHSLGAPDLYRYYDVNYIPVGLWDIMGNEADQHMLTYMKWRYGKWFSEISTISTAGNYKLKPISDSPYACFKIPSPTSSSEYFMVEYRKKGLQFEKSLPGSGLIVYRINNEMDGKGNAYGPKDEVYVYRFGGTINNNGNIGEAYFDNINRKDINDLTNPSCFLSNDNAGGVQISNIHFEGDEVCFDVSFNTSLLLLQTPNGYESWKAGNNYEIRWASKNVKSVDIEYSMDKEETWQPLASNVQDDLRKFTWKLPQQSSSEVVVRIFDHDNHNVFVKSQRPFIIRNDDFITENEPNDNFAFANILGVGDSVSAILNYGNDFDFYKFYADSAMIL